MRIMGPTERLMNNLQMNTAMGQANNYFAHKHDPGPTMAERMCIRNINPIAPIAGPPYVEPVKLVSYDFHNPKVPYGGSMRESTEDWIIGNSRRNLARDDLDREEHALDMRRRFNGII
jgi:hypothetical protein